MVPDYFFLPLFFFLFTKSREDELKFSYHLNMSIESLKDSVCGETKLVWVVLRCANYVEEHVETAPEIGCLWYDYDRILLNYHIFVRFIGKTNYKSIRSYLHSHKFTRDKSKEAIRANVPEKFNFSTFPDQNNWGICKCDGFNKDTTEEEAWQSEYDENFRTYGNRQNEANITNQTNFYSFQNRPAVAINPPMNNFYQQNYRQAQFNINPANFQSNFDIFNQRAPQRNVLQTPQISRMQAPITLFAPNNHQFNGHFCDLNTQYPNVYESSSNFTNFNQRTLQRNPLPIPQITEAQTNQQSNEPIRDLFDLLPSTDQESDEDQFGFQGNFVPNHQSDDSFDPNYNFF